VTGPPEITVLPTGTTIDTEQDETIIAALVRSGYLIRVGCKRGGCGICKVHLLAGEVRYERTVADTVLSDADRAAGICLACRAVPLTDAVIELQEGDRLRLMSPLLRRAAALTRARRAEARAEPADG
jgi:ferredoxin